LSAQDDIAAALDYLGGAAMKHLRIGKLGKLSWQKKGAGYSLSVGFASAIGFAFGSFKKARLNLAVACRK
jgi:hypothetical protein